MAATHMCDDDDEIFKAKGLDTALTELPLVDAMFGALVEYDEDEILETKGLDIKHEVEDGTTTRVFLQFTLDSVFAKGHKETLQSLRGVLRKMQDADVRFRVMPPRPSVRQIRSHEEAAARRKRPRNRMFKCIGFYFESKTQPGHWMHAKVFTTGTVQGVSARSRTDVMYLARALVAALHRYGGVPVCDRAGLYARIRIHNVSIHTCPIDAREPAAVPALHIARVLETQPGVTQITATKESHRVMLSFMLDGRKASVFLTVNGKITVWGARDEDYAGRVLALMQKILV